MIALSAALFSLAAAGTGPAGTTSQPEPPEVRLQEAIASPPQLAGYEKGAFVRSADGSFFLQANGRVQGRYTLESSAGEKGYGLDESAFSIPRARLKVGGHAFTPRLGFELQMDFGKGFFSLKDAWVGYALLPWLSLRVGQLKRPFSLQQAMSTSKLALVERAITNEYFDAGRDIGVQLSGGSVKDGPSFAVGVFNGSGDGAHFVGRLVDPSGGAVDGKFTNVPVLQTPMVVARVAWGFGGIDALDEVDLKGGRLRAAVGASGYVRTDPIYNESGRSVASVDAIAKAYGFTTTAALYTSFAGGATGHQAEAVGAHFIASYLIGGVLAPAAQYAVVMPFAPGEPVAHEALGGLSALLFGHNAKWSTDVGAVFEGAQPDLQLRTQLQLAF